MKREVCDNLKILQVKVVIYSKESLKNKLKLCTTIKLPTKKRQKERGKPDFPLISYDYTNTKINNII
ncbi:hypothetical protein EL17_07230 [Anditalea andensis]|uniref:Uncharacterized protein n=1 Tax=Anditalea andensis TaxID=1048983 RepID=A0A074KX10_9BACT|nr:hypothetical protein EL17_07230 [Anditalea andensis]